jgi:hypothetical protein
VTHLYPIAFFDPPHVLQANVSNIPGTASSPLQVIADIGFKASYAIDYIDTTGDYIGVYTGPAGHEVLNCIIGGGLSNRAWSVIPAKSRVSLRSMTASSITNGQLTCTFMGFGL